MGGALSHLPDFPPAVPCTRDAILILLLHRVTILLLIGADVN